MWGNPRNAERALDLVPLWKWRYCRYGMIFWMTLIWGKCVPVLCSMILVCPITTYILAVGKLFALVLYGLVVL